MERLVLSVWLTVVARTFAGGADRVHAAAPTGFPTLPVPAGNMLTEARFVLITPRLKSHPVSGPVGCCSPRSTRRTLAGIPEETPASRQS
jgi:hypothetical protein